MSMEHFPTVYKIFSKYNKILFLNNCSEILQNLEKITCAANFLQFCKNPTSMVNIVNTIQHKLFQALNFSVKPKSGAQMSQTLRSLPLKCS